MNELSLNINGLLQISDSKQPSKINIYKYIKDPFANIVMPSIIVVGVIGNILNLIVFGKETMRKTSTFRFLFYLSAFDLLVLTICLPDVIFQIKYPNEDELRIRSLAICRLHTFFTYFLIQSSSIILMIVSIDRALVMSNKNIILIIKRIFCLNKSNSNEVKQIKLNDFRNKNFQIFKLNLHRVDVVIISVIIYLTLLNSHYLIFLKIYETTEDTENDIDLNSSIINFNESIRLNSNSRICYADRTKPYFEFLTYYVWIDFLHYSFIPFTIMSICSFIILMKIRKSSKKYFRNLINKKNEANKTNFYRRLKRNRQLLYMLLITNLYFLVTSFTYSVIFIMNYGKERDQDGASFLIVHVLSYSNNAINFIFYGVSSQKYRETLRALFTKNPKSDQVVNNLRKIEKEKGHSSNEIEKIMVKKKENDIQL